MSIDLEDLVPSLKREVAVPGQEESLFPGASDEGYLGYLEDSFWEIRLDGMLAAYTDDDGSVSSVVDGGPDLSRDLQQLIVLYAGIRIIRNQLLTLNTTFRTKAGPVEYEIGKSATLLTGILDELKARRNLILTRLSDIGAVPSYYIDAIEARTYSIATGLTSFTR